MMAIMSGVTDLTLAFNKRDEGRNAKKLTNKRTKRTTLLCHKKTKRRKLE